PSSTLFPYTTLFRSQAHDDRLGRTGWLDRASKPERNANFYSENTEGALGVPLSASAGSNPTTPATQCDLNGAGSAFWKVRDIPEDRKSTRLNSSHRT